MIDLTQKELAILLLRGFLLGVALGIFYDAIRFLKAFFFVNYGRETENPHGIKLTVAIVVTFVTDVIFWIVAAISSTLLLYSVGGVFRGMTYPAMLAGFLLYYLSIGRLMLKLSIKLTRVIKRLLWWVIKFLLRPILFLFRMINSLYHLTIGKFLGTIKSRMKMAQERRKAHAAECSVGEETVELFYGKEDLVYVDGKTGYKREGRIRLPTGGQRDCGDQPTEFG